MVGNLYRPRIHSVSLHTDFIRQPEVETGLACVSRSKNLAQSLFELDLIDLPMVTGGMTGSVEEGLALTGIGVVGPFTIT